MSTKKCPKCGELIVYSEDDKTATCPNCNTTYSIQKAQNKTIDINKPLDKCPKCGS